MAFNNQEEWEAIIKFIENEQNVYPAAVDLYKKNKVRLIDIVNFLKIFYETRNEIVLNENFLFDYTAWLIKLDSLFKYERSEKTQLINLVCHNDMYCFYFKGKNKFKKNYIKIRKKKDSALGYQILDATYPLDVVVTFLVDNLNTLETIDNLKEEQKCCIDYNETVSGENYNEGVIEELLENNPSLIEKLGIDEARKYWYRLFNKLSTTIKVRVNEDVFHAFQIEDGEFKIYRISEDRTEGKKSVLMDEGNWEYYNAEKYKILMNKYFEMQTLYLSDFQDKELEMALRKYLVNLTTLRAKEDDGLDSYLEYLKILKEKGSRFAADALNEFMRQYRSEAIDWDYMGSMDTPEIHIKEVKDEKTKPILNTKLAKIIEEIRNPQEEFSADKYYKDYSKDQKKLLYVMKKMYSDKK